MKDRVALVTGGTKGIGKAIAAAFAKQGARVYINYSSDDDSARKAEQELMQTCGFSAKALKADVSNEEQVLEMFDTLLKEESRLDVLVNNAGIIRDGLLMMMPGENWRRVMEVNLNSVYYCSKAALRPMIERRWGRIINIASPSALLGRAGQCNYAASKGGVLSFTKSLSREVARLGITVNSVSPGVIETELTNGLPEKTRQEFLGLIPMGRLGRPEEAAHAVAFLASEAAAYITGELISVDGGLT